MCDPESCSGLDASPALVDAVAVVLRTTLAAAGVGFDGVAFNAFPWKGGEACMSGWGCAAFPNHDGAGRDGYFASEYFAGRDALAGDVSLRHAAADAWLLHLCAVEAESYKSSAIAALLRNLHLSQHMINEGRAVVTHFFFAFVVQGYRKMLRLLRARGQ